MAVASKRLQSTSAACLVAMLLTFQVGSARADYEPPPLTKNVPDSFKFAFGIMAGNDDMYVSSTGLSKTGTEIGGLSVDSKYQYLLNVKMAFDGVLADYARYRKTVAMNRFINMDAYAVLASTIEVQDRLGSKRQAYYLANNAVESVYGVIKDPNVRTSDVSVIGPSGNTVRGKKVVSFIEGLNEYNAVIKNNPSLSSDKDFDRYQVIQRFKFIYDSALPLVADYGKWSAAYNANGCSTSTTASCKLITTSYNSAVSNINVVAPRLGDLFCEFTSRANMFVTSLQNAAHYSRNRYYSGTVFGSDGKKYDKIRNDVPVLLSLYGDAGLYPHLLASKSLSKSATASAVSVHSLKTKASGPIRIGAAAPLSASVAVASKASIIPVSKTLRR